MAKIVLFVDALEPREIGGTRFAETKRGRVDSGAPKVTPKVTSEVYTGQDPTQTGMGGQHSISGDRLDRPMAPTIMEKLDRAGYNVMSLHMPYCHPLQMENQAFVSDTMQGPQPGPHPLAQMCSQPPAAGDLMDPEDDGTFAYNMRMQEVTSRSASMLQAIGAGNFDVVFLGIRSPDQYTHFQWHEDYRQELIKDIAFQIQQWEPNHEVMWWSDHGSEEKKETFRVNKWLMEKGYLDLDIDLAFNERFTKEMSQQQPNGGNPDRVENQIAVHSPGVEMRDGTEAVSMDPYDSSIDIMDDDLDADELIADMMDTGYYDYVRPVEEEWGNGPHRDKSPDLVALRADNVLVTGNVHPDPIGMGFMRSGVHSKYGVWGATDEDFAQQGDVTPQRLHDVIWEFVTGSSQVEQAVQQPVAQLEQQMQGALKESP